MDLGKLIERIEKKITNGEIVLGHAKYLGCSQNRGIGKTLLFQYEFKDEGIAKEYLIYDSDEDSSNDENVKTAGRILFNYIDRDATVEIFDITGNVSKIQIYSKKNNYNLEQEEIGGLFRKSDETSLDFYLESEANGLSAEESGFPDYYDEGRIAWLKKH